MVGVDGPPVTPTVGTIGRRWWALFASNEQAVEGRDVAEDRRPSRDESRRPRGTGH